MDAQVIVGKTRYTIRGADHLQVEGGLVHIQRSGPTGFETIAVAGEDLLVTIEPPECVKAEARQPQTARLDGLLWYPTGEPLD